MKRTLGRSGIEVSAVGMGCWAIGGPWDFLGSPAGWSSVDDAESKRAIHKAMELGVNFFDTAANYGCGHSERLLGEAVKGRRDKVVIATKFGYDVDEKGKKVTNYGKSEEESDALEHIREDVEKSLKRLQTDYIDVYFLHIWGLAVDRALKVRDILEKLVKEGKIRTYGWSTDRTDAIKAFATLPGCGVIEQQLNVFECNQELLSYCEKQNIASINRGPLGMGVLTGKFKPDTTFKKDDVRANANWFAGIQNGKPVKDWLDKVNSIREILTSEGRTAAQGALAWIWAKSNITVPIPGFRTEKQVEENAGAMRFGPLTNDQMNEIDKILQR